MLLVLVGFSALINIYYKANNNTTRPMSYHDIAHRTSVRILGQVFPVSIYLSTVVAYLLFASGVLYCLSSLVYISIVVNSLFVLVKGLEP